MHNYIDYDYYYYYYYRRVIEELMATEKSYVNDLKLVVDVIIIIIIIWSALYTCSIETVYYTTIDCKAMLVLRFFLLLSHPSGS